MNWADWSTSRKILLPAAALLFIDLFLDWQQRCASFGGNEICASRTGWHGVGVVVGILLLVLIVWEALQLFARDVTAGWNLPEGLIAAGLAAAVLLFTIIKFFADNEIRHWPAWLGLLLAVIVGVGGWLRFSESGGMTSMPARGGMGGGGTTTTTPPPPPPSAGGTPGGGPPPGGPPPNEPPPA